MNPRQRAGLALAGAVLVSVSGCGADDDGGNMKVSGNCGLGDDPISVEKVLPRSVLESLIADGDYQTVGGLIVKDGRLPAAYDGDCAIQEKSSGQDVLRLGLVNSSDARYAEAEELLESGDLRGFKKIDKATYVLPDGADGARGVSILPDRLVVIRVLRPAEGVDAVEQTGPAVIEVADRIKRLG